jgi:hypothetical protein
MLLFSWAVLFNLPEKLPTLAAYINKDPDDGEEDPFVHTLFNAFAINFPGKNAALLHPKPYAVLYESLRHDRNAQQAAMSKHLKAWYKSKAIKECYWHNRHSFKPSVHLGYWAFETGMLTVLNSLDDSSYRELNFYPRDLVDYCKAQGWQEELLDTLRAQRDK